MRHQSASCALAGSGVVPSAAIAVPRSVSACLTAASTLGCCATLQSWRSPSEHAQRAARDGRAARPARRPGSRLASCSAGSSSWTDDKPRRDRIGTVNRLEHVGDLVPHSPSPDRDVGRYVFAPNTMWLPTLYATASTARADRAARSSVCTRTEESVRPKSPSSRPRRKLERRARRPERLVDDRRSNAARARPRTRPQGRGHPSRRRTCRPRVGRRIRRPDSAGLWRAQHESSQRQAVRLGGDAVQSRHSDCGALRSSVPLRCAASHNV